MLEDQDLNLNQPLDPKNQVPAALFHAVALKNVALVKLEVGPLVTRCTVQTKPPKLLLYWAAAPANISAGAAQISAGPAGISAGAAEISAGAAEISGSLPGLN